MTRFFVDTGDGIEFKKTEAEAKTLASESLEFWRNRARQNGEWDDEPVILSQIEVDIPQYTEWPETRDSLMELQRQLESAEASE